MEIKRHPTYPVNVSNTGMVFDLVMNLYDQFVNSSNGYLGVNVPGNRTVPVHRLVAETFLPTDKPFKELYVNHKDGDKWNNWDSNLEWVTASENCLHAYQTGLRSDNREIDLKDLRDGSVYSFYSLQECSRFLGVNAERIHAWLKSKKPIPFLGLWDIRDKDGEWRGVTVEQLKEELFKRSFNVVVVRLEDGNRKITIYPTPTVAIHEEQMSKDDFVSILTSSLIEDTVIIKLMVNIQELKDTYAGLTIKDLRPKIVTPTRKPIPVLVENLKDNTTETYPSMEEFAATVNAKKNTIQSGILRNNGEWRNYRIEYLK